LPASHHRGPGQSIWDLWWTGTGGRLFSSSSLSPCRYHSTVAPYSYVIWEMNNRPLVAAIQRHSLSPHRHEYVFVLMSDQVSHPYKSGRITGLYASLFTFFDDTLDVSYRFINNNRHFRAVRCVHDGVSLKGSQEMIGSLAFGHQNPPLSGR
jgi:hypothetical protein